MIVEPERYIEEFARAGAGHILVQSEPSSTIHLHRVLSRIRELGKKAGAVLNPATPSAFVEHVLHLCDVVLVMTVNPGFGGQAFLPEMLPKIRELRRLCDSRGLNPAAILYTSGNINISSSARLKARILNSGEWSALIDPVFIIGPAPAIRVSEIMYNPAEPPVGSSFFKDDFEYLELINTGASPVNLPRTFYGTLMPEANRTYDRRQPLPSVFAAHWIGGGGPGSFSTDL